MEKWLSKYTDTLILINEEDYQLCKKRFYLCEDIQYVPGVGINEKKFDFELSDAEKLKIRMSLGLQKDDFVIIYPAELSKRKRQIWLINVLADLLLENKKIHLLLPGKDSLNGECQKLAKGYNLLNQIHFLGYRTDIPRLFKIADLSISSSNQEGLPVNVMEAMYVGLPIVASDCRGNRDLVHNESNCYLIEVNNGVDFKEKVKKVYDDRDSKKNIRSKLPEKYMLNNIEKQMDDIYFGNNIDKKKRINWIDNIKAFAIICIVFGHATAYCKDLIYLRRYLYSFHVPIFFAISGYLFKQTNSKMIEVLKKYFKKFMIPYFLYSFLFLVPYYLLNVLKPGFIENIGFSSKWSEMIYGIFYGTGIKSYLKQNLPLWFLPCFFTTMIIFNLISKRLDDKKIMYMMIISIVIGYLSSNNILPLLPFGLSTSLTMIFFVYYGMFLKKIINKNYNIIPYVLIVLGLFINSNNGFVLCMTNSYNNYFLFLMSAIMSITGYFMLFKKNNSRTILTIFGENTLYILLFHKPVLVIFQMFLGDFSKILINGNIVLQIVFSIFITMVSIIVSMCVMRLIVFIKKIKRGEISV